MYKDPRSYVQPLIQFGAIALLLSGCSNYAKNEWSEDVQISTEELVRVHRIAEGETYSEFGGVKSWDVKVNSLNVTDGQKIKMFPPVWNGEYIPILLDYQAATEQWSLVTTPNTCEAWYALGKPNPPYIEYQSISGSAWKRVPVEGRLIGRETNLLTGPRVTGEPNFVGISEKIMRRRNAAPKYRSIIRVWGVQEDNFC